MQELTAVICAQEHFVELSTICVIPEYIETA